MWLLWLLLGLPSSLTDTTGLNRAVDESLTGLNLTLQVGGLAGTLSYRWGFLRLPANISCSSPGLIRAPQGVRRTGDVLLADSLTQGELLLDLPLKAEILQLQYSRCELNVNGLYHQAGHMTANVVGPPILVKISLKSDNSSTFCSMQIVSFSLEKFLRLKVSGDGLIGSDRIGNIILLKMNTEVKDVVTDYLKNAIAGYLETANLCGRV